MDRVKLKLEAKKIAYAHKWDFWKPMMLIFVVSFVFGFVQGLLDIPDKSTAANIFSIMLTVVTYPIAIVTAANALKLVKGQKPDIEKLVKNCFALIVPIAITMFMCSLLIGLGTILLIVPGIILALSYSQVPYLLAEKCNKDTKFSDILKLSRTMMDGHKSEYFVLCLSFIGWGILCSITLGILLIWVMPYQQATYALYYEQLKKVSK